MSGRNCLLKVALSYVDEVAPDLTEENNKEVVKLFNSLLSSSISTNVACERLERIIGSRDPVLRIAAIMDIANSNSKPLPEEPEIDSYRENRKRKRARIWKPEEDMRLLAAIYRYGLDNWINISRFVGAGRSRSQCAQRWHRSINPDISKKAWTEEEDKKLLQLVDELGTTVWSRISTSLPGRCDVLCRYRYYQIKKNHVKTEEPNEISFDFSMAGSLESLFWSDKKINEILIDNDYKK